MSANLCRVKRSFKPYQNEHNSVKDTGEKGKKPCNIGLKISMKSCSIAHLPFLSSNCKILKVFLKTYPTKGKATKCPVREKKSEARKTKNKREGEKAKRISQDCCVTFKPKNYLEILLSVHARTSQADILHLDQRKP